MCTFAETEDFLYAIRMCLEHLGGVPSILTPDNLKSAVISNDRHEPKLNKALEDMGNYYHFVVLPMRPRHRHTEGSGRGLRKDYI